MKLKMVLIGFCVIGLLNAQTKLTVAQVVDFVRSSLALKTSDKQIASYLESVELTDKMSDKDLDDMIQQGAGPKTTKALQALHDRPAASGAKPSAATPAISSAMRELAAPVSPPPIPDSDKQSEMVESMRQYADNYTNNLPNFICLQVTKRAVARTGSDDWQRTDTIAQKLSYHDGHENYEMSSVNGKLTDTNLERLGGASSQGEFASIMRSIFDPASQAQFKFDHWGTWKRNQLVAVFTYSIERANSNYRVTWEAGKPDQQETVTGYRGTIVANPETGVILRIRANAFDIPATFPVQEASTDLAYDTTDINGNSYILPERALVEMRAGIDRSRNEIQFRLYRKFGTESTITFDDVQSAATDDQTKPTSAH